MNKLYASLNSSELNSRIIFKGNNFSFLYEVFE